MKEKIIVIDGIDGCGKYTQSNMLANYFKNQNIDSKLISFPNYEERSSELVKMYLNAEISENLNDVNAYAASSFYACDRYISYKTIWGKFYQQGYIIIADRYVTSNAIHQMVKLDKFSWDEYLDWLYDYEYNKLGLPKPDLVLFLDVGTNITRKLINNRYNGDHSKKDIHEKDFAYLSKCYETYKYIADKYKFDIISCCEDGEILSKEVIFKKIVKKL